MTDTPRYHRQALLPVIGPAGQAKLAAARVLLVGCGALGTHLAEQLVRAGVGHLRIADRDVVELSNLQRQVLFDESDAANAVPKAAAAARRLGAINSTVTVDPLAVDVHSGNVAALAGVGVGGPVGGGLGGVGESPVDLILDGTDNAATRYLLNDLAVKHRIPWVYGACVATEGRAMPILPDQTPCLRCLFPDPPAAGELPTCDTAGVLAAAAAVVASLQAVAAMQILLGASLQPRLHSIDVWTGVCRSIDLHGPGPHCPCCVQRQFPFLDAPPEASAAQLCGQDAVQIRPPRPQRIDLPDLARRLAAAGRVEKSTFMVRCHLTGSSSLSLTVFPDGRSIVQGTRDPAQARSIVSRYLGD
jgi:molybdopterin/thiamine biosynthesis adenylyltransferase